MHVDRHDIQIRMLGPLQVRVDGEERGLSGERRKALLGLLALHAGDRLDLDRLVHLLWGDSPPATAERSLRVHISHLRKLFEPADPIATTEGGYRLDVARDSIDLHRFHKRAELGRTLVSEGSFRAAAEELEAACREWSSPPLPDISDLEGVRQDVDHLMKVHASLELNLAEADLEVAGKSADVARFERLVAVHPYEERAWGLLMKALYWSGSQAEALRVYGRASRTFSEELGIDPSPQLRALEESIFAHAPEVAPPGPTPMELPSFPTGFIGREREVEQVSKLVTQHRLVSILGLGGAGKTRLAVEAAASAAASFDGGVAFVALEHLDDGRRVPDQVAARLGTDNQDIDHLAEAIGESRMLFVLDNCEHVVEAAADLVSELLKRCPSVAVLATSRIPLSVVGETTWVIPSMEVPDDSATPLDVASTEATALFLDRARIARPDFELDRDTSPVVSEISHRLSGNPLAIELTAARCDVLSPTDILDQLKDLDSDVISADRDRAERHHSMVSAIEWSLELLPDPTRTLLTRLSVFHDPFDLAGATTVCATPPIDKSELSNHLSTLASAALIQVDTSSDRSRFHLLPPVREVASALLVAGGEHDEIHQRHLDYFSSLTPLVATPSPDQPESFAKIDAVLDDIRAAIAYASEASPERAMAMCVDLGHYWMNRRLHDEGRPWLRQLLSRVEVSSQEKASVLHTSGTLAFDDGDLSEARRQLEEALELRRAIGDERAMASTLNNLGGVTSDAGDHEAAHRHYLAALGVFEDLDFVLGKAVTRINLGIVCEKLRRTTEAVQHLEESLELYRQMGDRSKEALVLERLAHVLEQEDPGRARALTRAAHHVHTEAGQPHEIARSLLNLAMRYQSTEDIEEAAACIGEASQLILDHALYDPWWVPALFETAGVVASQRGEETWATRLLGLGESHRRRHQHSESQRTIAQLETHQSRLRDQLGNSLFLEEFTIGESMSSRATLQALTDWDRERSDD